MNLAGVVILTEVKSISTTCSLFSPEEYTLNMLKESMTLIGFLNPTILMVIIFPAEIPSFLNYPSISSLLLSNHAHTY